MLNLFVQETARTIVTKRRDTSISPQPVQRTTVLSNKSIHPHRNPYSFNKEAIRNLSIFDQLLFERFGFGPITTVPYNCIHHAFEAQAAANPNAIAAEHLGDTITYRELDRQANRLGAFDRDAAGIRGSRGA